jgi:hypothetical protein
MLKMRPPSIFGVAPKGMLFDINYLNLPSFARKNAAEGQKMLKFYYDNKNLHHSPLHTTV